MSSTNSRVLQPFLDRLTKRSDLTRTEQEAVLSLPAREIQVERNEDFVRLGEIVVHANFIAAGLVGRFDQNASGERQITALHIPGDMPDLFSVVQKTATSALQALSPATILQLPHRAVRELARAHPAVAEAFWRDCIVDAMILAQWVVNVGRRNARSRIAHLLCEMATRFGAVADGTAEFHLTMTQAHLADATGLTPVHVSRSLGSLREMGVTFHKNVVCIADWHLLVGVGEFDPNYLQEDIKPEERDRMVQPPAR